MTPVCNHEKVAVEKDFGVCLGCSAIQFFRSEKEAKDWSINSREYKSEADCEELNSWKVLKAMYGEEESQPLNGLKFYDRRMVLVFEYVFMEVTK